jgi:hypothetical protein
MWARLATDDDPWNYLDPALTAVFVQDSSGIGDPRGRHNKRTNSIYSPQGYDYRLNYIPETRARGHPIFLPLAHVEQIAAGHPPAYWSATTRDTINA